MGTQSTTSIARFIDHALLHPTMTDEQLREGCLLAKKLGVVTVCVKPYAVKQAKEILHGSNTGVGTVIGFPHGSSATEIKAAEADLACRDGAVELDMVINIGKAIQNDWEYVEQDIQAVVAVAKNYNSLVKVIFETDLVSSDDAKRKLCEICESSGVDYVKTSTGFGFVKQANGDYNYSGATADDIKLMRKACSNVVGVKASGGIRNFEDANLLRELGATRLGTSASQTIIDGAGNDDDSY